MPTPTYTPLATITISASVASVTFSSIPSTYRDLVIISTINPVEPGSIYVRLNGDTGNNYTSVTLSGSPDGATSGTASTSYAVLGISRAGSANIQNAITEFFDYSATDKHKTMLGRQRHSTEAATAAARWANTNAITSIQISAAGNFTTTSYASGTTISLYGVIA
jgi:hypothetical protein